MSPQDERRNFVEYLEMVGIFDGRVLQAFSKVPREKFVSEEFLEDAYMDIALPIAEGQTISQPSLVAMMVEALKLSGDEKVLEIGTGSGFGAAILSQLAKEVVTVERIESLAKNAKKLLKSLNYKNVEVILGNGTQGYPEKAPYDAIIVTATAVKVPNKLIEQLTEGGRMVLPLEIDGQELMLGKKIKGKLELENIEPVRFVPLVGKY